MLAGRRQLVQPMRRATLIGDPPSEHAATSRENGVPLGPNLIRRQPSCRTCNRHLRLPPRRGPVSCGVRPGIRSLGWAGRAWCSCELEPLAGRPCQRNRAAAPGKSGRCNAGTTADPGQVETGDLRDGPYELPRHLLEVGLFEDAAGWNGRPTVRRVPHEPVPLAGTAIGAFNVLQPEGAVLTMDQRYPGHRATSGMLPVRKPFDDRGSEFSVLPPPPRRKFSVLHSAAPPSHLACRSLPGYSQLCKLQRCE